MLGVLFPFIQEVGIVLPHSSQQDKIPHPQHACVFMALDFS